MGSSGRRGTCILCRESCAASYTLTMSAKSITLLACLISTAVVSTIASVPDNHALKDDELLQHRGRMLQIPTPHGRTKRSTPTPLPWNIMAPIDSYAWGTTNAKRGANSGRYLPTMIRRMLASKGDTGEKEYGWIVESNGGQSHDKDVDVMPFNTFEKISSVSNLNALNLALERLDRSLNTAMAKQIEGEDNLRVKGREPKGRRGRKRGTKYAIGEQQDVDSTPDTDDKLINNANTGEDNYGVHQPVRAWAGKTRSNPPWKRAWFHAWAGKRSRPHVVSEEEVTTARAKRPRFSAWSGKRSFAQMSSLDQTSPLNEGSETVESSFIKRPAFSPWLGKRLVVDNSLPKASKATDHFVYKDNDDSVENVYGDLSSHFDRGLSHGEIIKFLTFVVNRSERLGLVSERAWNEFASDLEDILASKTLDRTMGGITPSGDESREMDRDFSEDLQAFAKRPAFQSWAGKKKKRFLDTEKLSVLDDINIGDKNLRETLASARERRMMLKSLRNLYRRLRDQPPLKGETQQLIADDNIEESSEGKEDEEEQNDVNIERDLKDERGERRENEAARSVLRALVTPRKVISSPTRRYKTYWTPHIKRPAFHSWLGKRSARADRPRFRRSTILRSSQAHNLASHTKNWPPELDSNFKTSFHRYPYDEELSKKKVKVNGSDTEKEHVGQLHTAEPENSHKRKRVKQLPEDQEAGLRGPTPAASDGVAKDDSFTQKDKKPAFHSWSGKRSQTISQIVNVRPGPEPDRTFQEGEVMERENILDGDLRDSFEEQAAETARENILKAPENQPDHKHDRTETQANHGSTNRVRQTVEKRPRGFNAWGGKRDIALGEPVDGEDVDERAHLTSDIEGANERERGFANERTEEFHSSGGKRQFPESKLHTYNTERVSENEGAAHGIYKRQRGFHAWGGKRASVPGNRNSLVNSEYIQSDITNKEDERGADQTPFTSSKMRGPLLETVYPQEIILPSENLIGTRNVEDKRGQRTFHSWGGKRGEAPDIIYPALVTWPRERSQTHNKGISMFHALAGVRNRSNLFHPMDNKRPAFNPWLAKSNSLKIGLGNIKGVPYSHLELDKKPAFNSWSGKRDGLSVFPEATISKYPAIWDPPQDEGSQIIKQPPLDSLLWNRDDLLTLLDSQVDKSLNTNNGLGKRMRPGPHSWFETKESADPSGVNSKTVSFKAPLFNTWSDKRRKRDTLSSNISHSHFRPENWLETAYFSKRKDTWNSRTGSISYMPTDKRPAFHSWSGKRNGDSETFPDQMSKRPAFHAWSGKRDGHSNTPMIQTNKRPTFHSWSGKRHQEDQSRESKRPAFQSWSGKRDSQSAFPSAQISKRPAFHSWSGKRDSQSAFPSAQISKRPAFHSWSGKRDSQSAFPSAQISKRPTFHSWSGKRDSQSAFPSAQISKRPAFHAWSGKRDSQSAFPSAQISKRPAFHSWSGKRDSQSAFPSAQISKRPAFHAWSGKRSSPMSLILSSLSPQAMVDLTDILRTVHDQRPALTPFMAAKFPPTSLSFNDLSHLLSTLDFSNPGSFNKDQPFRINNITAVRKLPHLGSFSQGQTVSKRPAFNAWSGKKRSLANLQWPELTRAREEPMTPHSSLHLDDLMTHSEPDRAFLVSKKPAFHAWSGKRSIETPLSELEKPDQSFTQGRSTSEIKTKWTNMPPLESMPQSKTSRQRVTFQPSDTLSGSALKMLFAPSVEGESDRLTASSTSSSSSSHTASPSTSSGVPAVEETIPSSHSSTSDADKTSRQTSRRAVDSSQTGFGASPTQTILS